MLNDDVFLVKRNSKQALALLALATIASGTCFAGRRNHRDVRSSSYTSARHQATDNKNGYSFNQIKEDFFAAKRARNAEAKKRVQAMDVETDGQRILSMDAQRR